MSTLAAGRRVRVLVIDGDAVVRRDLQAWLAEDTRLEPVGAARSVHTALEKLPFHRPDVVVLGAVDQQGGAALTLLAAGLRAQGEVSIVALDDGSRPGSNGLAARVVSRTELSQPRLCAAVLSAATKASPSALAPLPAQAHAAVPPAAAAPFTDGERPLVVAIGASTGGPNALSRVVSALPADLPVPVLIVQHMPAGFTESLAQSLATGASLPVREARDGEPLQPGQVLLAPGGRHLGVASRGDRVHVELSAAPPEHSCRPAVDFLFRSLLPVYGARTVAVVMTGMGEDGLAGAVALHAAGARVLAQDEASCTVYGMPRGPIERGIAEAVPLDDLARRIDLACRRKVRR